MDHPKRNIIKIVIIILAVLLGMSLTALVGTVLYQQFSVQTGGTVTVPDNLITPDGDKSSSDPEASASDEAADSTFSQGSDGRLDVGYPDYSNSSSAAGEGASADETSSAEAPDRSQEALPDESTSVPESSLPTETPDSSEPVQPNRKPSAGTGTDHKKTATVIGLSKRHDQDNLPFSVNNLFPGDSETKYYCLRVSYQDAITVHFKIDVRQGSEKLAEVLKVKVKLLTTGETLYDGLMGEMSQSLTHWLGSSDSTVDELYYEVTAYLDSSVGNEYQNKGLTADFQWWVEEEGRFSGVSQVPESSAMSRTLMTLAAGNPQK